MRKFFEMPENQTFSDRKALSQPPATPPPHLGSSTTPPAHMALNTSTRTLDALSAVMREEVPQEVQEAHLEMEREFAARLKQGGNQRPICWLDPAVRVNRIDSS